MQVSLAGTPVGDVSMDVDYLADDMYEAVRSRGRKTSPPSSDDYRAAGPGGVPPWRVGRNHAANVLLLAPRVDDEAICASLRVLGEHPSMFDHAQDHLPGMVLMEAGRQACVMAAEHFAGIAPRQAVMTELNASFSAYAELDTPTTVTAFRPEPCTDPDAHTMRITFAQNDQLIAETFFTVRSTVAAESAESVRPTQCHSRRTSRTTDRAAVITGLGSWTPPDAVTNDMLADELDTSDEWIKSRTGIGQRHIVSPGTSTSDLAIEAGRRALQSSQDGDSVHAVVLATSTPDRSCPATAPLVASKLGLSGVAAFDVGAVCTGFLYALATAAGFISAHAADTVLVIGADAFSTILHPDHRSTRVIFGDGAGAVVLRAGSQDEPGALLGFDLGSDGDAGDMITVPAGGSEQRSTGIDAEEAEHYFQMDGKPVFARAVQRMTESAKAIVEAAEWRLEEIDHFVAHQANARILNACARELGLSPERMPSNLDRVGNTVAASIPLALADASESGDLVAGERVVLTAFGGGLTWGSTALIWPDIAVHNRPTFTETTKEQT